MGLLAALVFASEPQAKEAVFASEPQAKEAASAPFEELERVKVLCSATTMDSIYVLTLALAAIAAVAYILMAARERGAVDSPQVTTILSWVLLVLVSTAVGQALMYDPEEAPMLKILYGMAIVLALANAVVEVVTDDKQKRRDENKIFVWGASGVALLAIVVIALRATAWEQTRKRLAVLREEYVVEPGEDRVAAAEGVIVRQGPGRGVMKRALRILNRAARKRSAARV